MHFRDSLKHGLFPLLCHLLNIGIDHKFLTHPITYRNVRNNRKILKFKNNRGHFEKA